MSNNNLRKEKEREFYIDHMETFKTMGLVEPFFTIKTAFLRKENTVNNVNFLSGN
jgi:hypothetical protein